jgi:hypothetical protein
MNKLALIIGSFVIAILFISIPMLTVISVVGKWHGFIQLILCCATLLEIAKIASVVIERSESDE